MIAQTVDFNACDSLVAKNVNLARSVTIPFVRTGERVEDTPEFSDALWGLWDAAKSYDPEIHKTRFSTYASTCCRNRILNGHKKKRRDEVREMSLPEDVPDQRESPLPLPLLEVFFAPHPNDSSRDRRNKKVLYDHYIHQKSWKQIAQSMNVTPTRVMQYGRDAIALIRQRFPHLIDN
jgi:RNA polymerase sigma factor (sigma-70 family)